MATTIFSLPESVLLSVFQHISLQRSSTGYRLSNCAAVCRAWQPLAESITFQGFELDGVRDLKRLIKLGRTQHIRSLSVWADLRHGWHKPYEGRCRGCEIMLVLFLRLEVLEKAGLRDQSIHLHLDYHVVIPPLARRRRFLRRTHRHGLLCAVYPQTYGLAEAGLPLSLKLPQLSKVANLDVDWKTNAEYWDPGPAFQVASRLTSLQDITLSYERDSYNYDADVRERIPFDAVNHNHNHHNGFDSDDDGRNYVHRRDAANANRNRNRNRSRHRGHESFSDDGNYFRRRNATNANRNRRRNDYSDDDESSYHSSSSSDYYDDEETLDEPLNATSVDFGKHLDVLPASLSCFRLRYPNPPASMVPQLSRVAYGLMQRPGLMELAWSGGLENSVFGPDTLRDDEKDALAASTLDYLDVTLDLAGFSASAQEDELYDLEDATRTLTRWQGDTLDKMLYKAAMLLQRLPQGVTLLLTVPFSENCGNFVMYTPGESLELVKMETLAKQYRPSEDVLDAFLKANKVHEGDDAMLLYMRWNDECDKLITTVLK